MKMNRRLVEALVIAVLCLSATVYAADVTVTVNAGAPVRTIPETMFGGNLTAWDGAQNGSNSTFNNLMIASGRKYMRWCGGSWGDAFLWSDMEEWLNTSDPNAPYTWIVSYNETLSLLNILSQPGETVHPTLQPIVNFPGYWYDVDHNDADAIAAAVAWVQDQSARTPTAQYWEIGNETPGPWEAGWFSGIRGSYYGDKYADFYLAMKAVNPNIKIGAVAEEYDVPDWWNPGLWTRELLTAAYAKGVVPDFLIIHQYPCSDQDATFNPTLLGTRVDDIASFTSSLNSIIADSIGPQYVGQIKYWMTEWDAGATNTYNRRQCYVNALFHSQYTLEIAKNNWEGANAWAQWEYGSNFFVYPVWYIHPLLINKFGRNMVVASSSDSIVRAYASTDASGNLTIFIANNSPSAGFTAQINIAGMTAGQAGQKWMVEPAGNIVSEGLTIQDRDNISINGIVHPDPLTLNSIAAQAFTSGSVFILSLPKSCMVFLKVPAGTGDTNAPSVPTGLAVIGNAGRATLNWNDNNEFDLVGYNVYRSTTSGSGYTKLNATLLSSSDYSDTTVVGGTTYYYVITAVDTYWNESDNSGEASATPSVLSQTVYNFAGINTANTNYNSFACDVDQFPFGNNSSNRNSFVEAIDSQYTYISANDSSEWATSNPGIGDEVFMWNEMKINESPGNITSIDLTFNGYTGDSSAVAHKIYVLTADANWTVDTNWTQLGDDQSISPGSYATMTRSITSDFSKYINASGRIVWGIYETTSYKVMHVNYLAMSVYSSGAAAPTAPTGLTATAGFQTITLDWNDNNESDFAGYNVYRSTTSGYGYNKLNSSLLNSSDYTDSNVIGIPYYYVVTAVDINENQSNYSNQASATPEVYHNCAEVQAAGFGLVSDLDGDCYVGYPELEALAFYWLYTDCVAFNNCDGTDFEPVDGTVDLLDFSDFARQWLWCNDPQDPGCSPNW